MTFRCFIHGLNLYNFAIYIALGFSSNIFQFTLAVAVSIGKRFFLNSLISLITGMASRNTYINLIYSLSVEDKAYSVFSFYLCNSGHSVYIMTYPRLCMVVYGSSVSFRYQLPAKSSSAYTYKSFPLTGLSMVPLSYMNFRFLEHHMLASPCSLSGQIVKRAHW